MKNDEKNIDRGIKKNFTGRPQTAIITCPPGWRDVCADEIHYVLSHLVHPGKFQPEMTILDQSIMVTNLDFRNLMELPLRLTTVREVQWVIRSSHVGDVGDLRESLHKVDWELLFHKEQKISARTDSFGSVVYHEGLMRDVLQEVLMRHHLNLVAPEESEFHLRLVLEKNRMTLGLALGGPRLYQRGYKASYKTKAPLQEHVAAALNWFAFKWIETKLGQGPWRPASIFVPFAGSGTLGFEAVNHVTQIAPVLWRDEYGFEHAPWYPADTVKFCRKQLRHQFSQTVREMESLRVVFMDNVAAAVQETEENSEKIKARLQTIEPNWRLTIEVNTGDFFEIGRKIILANGVFVPLNPPFGVRLSQGAHKGADFFARLATDLTYIAEKTRGVFAGYCLVPDESTWSAFVRQMESLEITTRHFTLGGQDMRVVFFLRNFDGSPF